MVSGPTSNDDDDDGNEDNGVSIVCPERLAVKL